MCTLVQAQSIPAVLGGKDHVVKAKTGTGKTLAFLIPAIERVRHATLAQSDAAPQCAKASNEALGSFKHPSHSGTVAWHGHCGSSACVKRFLCRVLPSRSKTVWQISIIIFKQS